MFRNNLLAPTTISPISSKNSSAENSKAPSFNDLPSSSQSNRVLSVISPASRTLQSPFRHRPSTRRTSILKEEKNINRRNTTRKSTYALSFGAAVEAGALSKLESDYDKGLGIDYYAEQERKKEKKNIKFKDKIEKIELYKQIQKILAKDDNIDTLKIKKLMKEEDEEEDGEWFTNIDQIFNEESEKFVKFTDSQNIIICEKKNEFELLRIYADPYPCLALRKQLLYYQTLCSHTCHKITESKFFEFLIVICVIMACVLLMIEDPTQHPHGAEVIIEEILLGFFTLEFALKICAYGVIFPKHAYFRDFWNIIDFVIIFTAFLPFLLTKEQIETVSLTSLKVLRVLHPLRTISSFEKLKKIFQILVSTIPLLIDILALLLFFFIFFAGCGIHLFSGGLKNRCFDQFTGLQNPDSKICGYTGCEGSDLCGKLLINPGHGITNFDNFLISFVITFQLVTMQAWTSVMAYVLQSYGLIIWCFFIPLIFIGAFFLINLTLAAIKAKFTDTQNSKILSQELVEEISRVNVSDLKWFKRLERLHFKRMKMKLKSEYVFGAREDQNKGYGITWEDITYLKELEKNKKLKEEEERYFYNFRNGPINEQALKDREAIMFLHRLQSVKKEALKNFFHKNTFFSNIIDTNNINVEKNSKKITLKGIKTIQIKKPDINGDNENFDEEDFQSIFGNDAESQSKNKVFPENFEKSNPNTLKLKDLKLKKSVSKLKILYKRPNMKSNSISPFEHPIQLPDILDDKDLEFDQENIEKSHPLHKDKKLEIDFDLDLDFKDDSFLRERNTPEIIVENASNKNPTSQKNHHHHNGIDDQLQKKKNEKNVLNITSLNGLLTNKSNVSNSSEVLIDKKSDDTIKGKDLIALSKSHQNLKEKLDLHESSNIRHYKLNVNHKTEYSSFSTNDVMEGRAEKRELEKQQKLFESIFGTIYPINHVQLQEITDETILAQIKYNKKLEKRYSIETRLPRIAVKKRKATFNFENYPNIQMREYGKNKLFSPLMQSSKNPQKRKKPIEPFKLDDGLQFNYGDLSIKIEEPIENSNKKEEIAKFQEEKEYYDIHLKDYELNKKDKYIWSGQEVAPYRVIRGIWKINRLNKIFHSLSTINLDLVVWLPGFFGFLIVLKKKYERVLSSPLFYLISFIFVLLYVGLICTDGLVKNLETKNQIDEIIHILNIFFIVESLFKYLIYGNNKFFKKYAEVFDAFVALMNLLEILFEYPIFKIMGILRVMRILRSLSFMKYLIHVIKRALENYVYILSLLILFLLIFALLGMNLFGGQFTVLNMQYRQNFDNYNNALIAAFQVLTSTVWQQILYLGYVAKTSSAITFLYLFSWIFIGNYVFLNIFLAIILEEFTKESIEIKAGQKSLQEDIIPKDYVMIKNNNILQLVNSALTADTKTEHKEKKNKKKTRYINIECKKSFWIFSKKNKIRIICHDVTSNSYFQNFILFSIMLSCVKMSVETYFIGEKHLFLEATEYILDLIMILEFVAKTISGGFFFDEGSYLRNKWNIFEFFVVLFAILEILIDLIQLDQFQFLKFFMYLRPFRLVSHNKNLKIVVSALMDSLSSMINVLFVIALIWLMFALLGISLLKDRMGYCDGVSEIYEVGIYKCQELNGVWKNRTTNFDNVINAMITLFILSSREVWINTMFFAQDANDKEFGPSFKKNVNIQYFFVAFILIGSYFLINLFVGVIFFHFNKAQQNEKNKSSILLTDEQEKWLNIQKMIANAKPDFLSFKKPNNPLLLRIHSIVTKKEYEYFMMLSVFINILILCLYTDTLNSSFKWSIEASNIFFSFIFVIDVFCKIISFGYRGYFYLAWNQFDFILSLFSLLEILIYFFDNYWRLRRIKIFIKILKVPRFLRTLKLIKIFKGVQKLLETLLLSIPSLINVGSLLLLVVYVYSILGVSLFSKSHFNNVITEFFNFSNFGFSMIIMFKVLTGDDWFDIMFELSFRKSGCEIDDSCGSVVSIIFFISFFIICSYIMLNLFILMIIQQFEKYYFNEDNAVNNFKKNLIEFRKIWSEFSELSLGFNIPSKKLVEFYLKLQPPLGFGPLAEKPKVALEIMKMNLMGDDEGNIYFNDLLFATMKRVFGAEILNDVTKEIRTILESQENKIKQKIEQKTKQLINSFYIDSPQARPQKLKINKDSKDEKSKKQNVNPIITILFVGMTFKSWKRFAERKINNELLNNDSLPEIEEESEEDDESQENSQENLKQNEQNISSHSSSESEENKDEDEDYEKENDTMDAISNFLQKNKDESKKKNMLLAFFNSKRHSQMKK